MLAEELLVTLHSDKTGRAHPYHVQIYRQVRQAILEGRLSSGDRLPATRDLAAKLGLARNTVARAYADLLAEGYLAGRVGSGTYVASELGAGSPQGSALGAPVEGDGLAGSPRGLTDWGSRVLREVPDGSRGPALPYDFRLSTPDWDAFPRVLWLQLLGRAVRREAEELGRYGEPAGYFPLRQAIARHLALSRGVVATAEQVVIVGGSQQALDLLTRLWIRPGATVVVEEPGYPEARRAFTAVGAKLLPIPVDADGLDVESLERQTAASAARLVYVTPSHQFPTGVTLSLARRLALLEWAGRRDVLIVEDDYDSEFRYTGRPVESLQGLDRFGRVVYLGTFSTVLFPPLRVGYVVLPPDLVGPFVKAKWLADRQTPTLEQLALTDFLTEGHFGRHLRRMRRVAAERRAALLAAVADHLDSQTEQLTASTGMHVMLPLPSVLGTSPFDLEAAIALRAAARGVGVYPAGPCCVGPPAAPALLLGFAALPTARIQEGIGRLAQAVREVRAEGLPRRGGRTA
jgi:GntR family transcriptional regulator / MocR family aminotransferase